MINIYCDESCHLENDNQKSMVLGGIWCPLDKRKDIINSIYKIKDEHGIKRHTEIKWTKVSNSKINYFQDLIRYFFSCSDLHFRGVIIKDKSKLNHQKFNQTHDEWYYKMYFELLKTIIDPKEKYNIYLDIKDTRSADKVVELKEVLSNSLYDYDYTIIHKIQNVRSEECVILQLADLIMGALGYYHRGIDSSEAKLSIISLIKELSGYSLDRTTLYKESKLNLLVWEG